MLIKAKRRNRPSSSQPQGTRMSSGTFALLRCVEERKTSGARRASSGPGIAGGSGIGVSGKVIGFCDVLDDERGGRNGFLGDFVSQAHRLRRARRRAEAGVFRDGP